MQNGTKPTHTRDMWSHVSEHYFKQILEVSFVFEFKKETLNEEKNII